MVQNKLFLKPCVYFLYLSHLLYGICVNIFIMNRYISKSYTTSKNTIDRQYTERGQLWCQLLLVIIIYFENRRFYKTDRCSPFLLIHLVINGGKSHPLLLVLWSQFSGSQVKIVIHFDLLPFIYPCSSFLFPRNLSIPSPF